jgi:uncharacterized membrane protein
MERFPLRPGIVLGIGLGGFVDGIVLHQILQWHHMVSSAGYPPTDVGNLRINVFFDGFFHAMTWIATALGLFLVHRAVRRGDRYSGRRIFGGIVMGWGIFNLVEGLIDHHLLGLHHVREAAANPLLWDLGFLAFGALLVLAGYALAQSDIGAARRRELRRAA